MAADDLEVDSATAGLDELDDVAMGEASDADGVDLEDQIVLARTANGRRPVVVDNLGERTEMDTYACHVIQYSSDMNDGCLELLI